MTQQMIQEALDWRYATKRFDPSRAISDADWQTLAQSFTKAPSAFGVQPWKFVVVENPDVRARLREAAYNQSQITDASKIVVFLYRDSIDETYVDNHLRRVAEVRGVPPASLEGYRQSLINNLVKADPDKIRTWAQRQPYIAMGFLVETAALLHIDACPMEGFDAKAFDRILGLEGSGWKSVATVALGYRHPEDSFQNLKKVRFADETLVTYVK